MTKIDDLVKGRSPRREPAAPQRPEPQWEAPDAPRDRNVDVDDDDEEERGYAALPAGTLTDYAQRLQERRRSLLRRMVIQLSIFVLLPTLLVGVYYGTIASPRYLSEARLTVQAKSEAVTSMFSAFLGPTGGSAAKELYILQNYITSPEALGNLDKWLDLRGHYSSEQVDWWSRLKSDASEEDFQAYYADRIEAEIATDGEILTIRAEAFEPELATSIAESLLSLSEELLNKLAERAREDAVSFARREVATAEERLRDIRLRLLDFRNLHGELNPVNSAATISGIVATIEQDLASARAELAQLRTFMQEDSPRVIALRTRIAILQSQMGTERSRLATPDGGTGAARQERPATTPSPSPNARPAQEGEIYSTILNGYETLLIEEEFARRAYEAAFTGLEVARADAARKHSYIVDFVPPGVPQEALRPERLTETATAFAVLLVGYLIGGFLIGALREHARL